jgi:hypothetical protein
MLVCPYLCNYCFLSLLLCDVWLAAGTVRAMTHGSRNRCRKADLFFLFLGGGVLSLNCVRVFTLWNGKTPRRKKKRYSVAKNNKQRKNASQYANKGRYEYAARTQTKQQETERTVVVVVAVKKVNRVFFVFVCLFGVYCYLFFLSVPLQNGCMCVYIGRRVQNKCKPLLSFRWVCQLM